MDVDNENKMSTTGTQSSTYGKWSTARDKVFVKEMLNNGPKDASYGNKANRWIHITNAVNNVDSEVGDLSVSSVTRRMDHLIEKYKKKHGSKDSDEFYTPLDRLVCEFIEKEESIGGKKRKGKNKEKGEERDETQINLEERSVSQEIPEAESSISCANKRKKSMDESNDAPPQKRLNTPVENLNSNLSIIEQLRFDVNSVLNQGIDKFQMEKHKEENTCLKDIEKRLDSIEQRFIKFQNQIKETNDMILKSLETITAAVTPASKTRFIVHNPKAFRQ